MVDAWSADSGIKDADEKKAGAKALEEAVIDNVIDAFICVAGAHDAIPYMHHVSSILIFHACHIYVVYLHYTMHIIARHVMSLRLCCVRLRFLELRLLFLQVVAHISEWIEERGSVDICAFVSIFTISIQRAIRDGTQQQRYEAWIKEGCQEARAARSAQGHYPSFEGGAEHEPFSALGSPYSNTRANKRQWRQVSNAVVTRHAVRKVAAIKRRQAIKAEVTKKKLKQSEEQA
jgi:hypothetical protein